MTVTIGSPVSPTFNQLNSVCVGSTFTLPSSSLEGINGAWSPAINTAATTTYTFTPATGQCANTATMTVAITSPVVPTFPTYGPFCLNDVLVQVMLPGTSNNGIVGSWNPGMLSTAISGVTSYTFTPSAGQCATPYTANVLVNALPVINLSNSVVTNENCGQGDGSISGIVVPGASANYTYSWNNSQQLTTLDLMDLSSGTYVLEVTDGNGCIAQATVEVLGNQPPVIDQTGLNIQQPTCNDGGDIFGLVVSGNQPFTYTWTNSNQTTANLVNAAPGSYSLTVTDAGGCESTFGPIVLNQPIYVVSSKPRREDVGNFFR